MARAAARSDPHAEEEEGGAGTLDVVRTRTDMRTDEAKQRGRLLVITSSRGLRMASAA